MRTKHSYWKWLLVVAVMVGLVGTLAYCLHEKNKELRIRRSQYLTAEANKLMAEGDVALAQLLLLEALPENLRETEVALRQSLNGNTIILSESKEVQNVEISPDDEYVMGSSYRPSRLLYVWKVGNGELLDTMSLSEEAEVCFGKNGTILIMDSLLMVYDIQRKAIVRKVKSSVFKDVSCMIATPTGDFVVMDMNYSEALCVLNLDKMSYYKLPFEGRYVSDRGSINDSVFTYYSNNNLYCINLFTKRYRHHECDDGHYEVFNDKYVISTTGDENMVSVATFGDERSVRYYKDYKSQISLGQISFSGEYFATVDSLHDIVIYDMHTGEVYKRIERDHYRPEYGEDEVMDLLFSFGDKQLLCFSNERYECYRLDDGSIWRSVNYPYTITGIELSSNQEIALIRYEHSRSSSYGGFELDWDGKYIGSSSVVRESPSGNFILYRNENDNSIRLEATDRQSNYVEPDTVALMEDVVDGDCKFVNFYGSGLQMCVSTESYYVLNDKKITQNNKISGEYVGYCTNPDLLITLKNHHFYIWNPRDGELLKKVELPKCGKEKEIYLGDVFYDVLKEEWIVQYSYYVKKGDRDIAYDVECQFDIDDLTLKFKEERADTICRMNYCSNPKVSADKKWAVQYSDIDAMIITDGLTKDYHDIINLNGYMSYYSSMEHEFSPGGDKLLVECAGIKVYDVKTCQLMQDYSYLQDEPGFIRALAFSCDEKSIYYIKYDFKDIVLFRIDFEPIDKIVQKVKERLDGRKMTEKERRRYCVSL